MTELAPFASQAAAELATGALALTLPSDPGRPARTAAAVRALTAAGQWDEAEPLVRSALAIPLPAREGAALRCALASLLALTECAAEAMTEAQTVLTNSDVPADLRDDATVALLWAWLGLRGNRQVDQLAGIILAEPGTKRSAIVVAAMVALGVARWDSGRITEALDLAAQAVRQATERPYETTYFSPHLLLASALIYVRRLDEATVITNSVESVEGAVASPWPEGTTEILRARIALAAGRLDDADALAQSALRSVQASAPGAGDSLAVPVLATIALRRGDLAAAAEYGQRLSAATTAPRIWPTGSAWWRPRSWRPGAGRGRRWTSWRRRWLACPSTGRCCWPIRPARRSWSRAPWPRETARWPPGLSQPSTTRHETTPRSPSSGLRPSTPRGCWRATFPACSTRPTSWRTLGPAPAR